jgi:hypothetical protein
VALFDSSPQRARARPAARGLRLPGFGTVAASALVAAAALLPVVQSSNATTTAHDIRRLETRKADLQAAIYNAQTEIAQLGSLERIDHEARGRLGMTTASRSTVVQVSEASSAPRQVPARYLPQEDKVTEASQTPRRGPRALLARLFAR